MSFVVLVLILQGLQWSHCNELWKSYSLSYLSQSLYHSLHSSNTLSSLLIPKKIELQTFELTFTSVSLSTPVTLQKIKFCMHRLQL